MKLTARQLREERKKRIAARAKMKNRRGVKAQGEGEEEMPDWLEEKIDEEPGGGGEEEMPVEEEEESEGQEETFPADLPEESSSAERATSAFNYNPIYQKQTSLGPKGQKSGYHYFGPPPDAGTSYGYFLDASSKVGIIAPYAKGKQVFSPVTGKAMKFLGQVDTDGLATVLAVADQMVSLSVGEETRMTSAPLLSIESPKVFDALTGQDITQNISTLKAQEGEEPEEEEPPAEGQEEEPMLPMEGQEDEEEEPMFEEEPPAEGQEEEPMLPMEGQEDEEPGEDEEPEEEEEEEGTEAVQYEALQGVDDFEEPLSESDVHMTLFDEGTADAPGDNPFWNIDISGQPVARVYLKDQPKPEEIREVFCSADYHRGLAGAIEKVGLKPVLKQLKAKVWANAVQKTKLAQNIKAQVEAESKERVTALTKNLMKDLIQRIAIVCAGMDKNFYKDIGNPLKEALWGEMNSYGIPNPAPIIEAGFRKGSTKYFETVLSKAVEYMELSPETLDQIQNAIGDMDVMTPGDGTVGDELPEANPEQAPTLHERLAASSVAIAGIPTQVGNALGDHKANLRRELRLGGAGPRLRR